MRTRREASIELRPKIPIAYNPTERLRESRVKGAKEAGIEEGRNNNVGKNETQNRVSEIGTGGKQLKRRSAHLTEISGIKAGNVLCQNLFRIYFLSKFGRKSFG